MTTKGRLGNLALLVASLLFCILLAEAFCRLGLAQPNYSPRATMDLSGLWVEHPTRVVAFAPNFSGTHRTKDLSVPIRTDAGGSGRISLLRLKTTALHLESWRSEIP